MEHREHRGGTEHTEMPRPSSTTAADCGPGKGLPQWTRRKRRGPRRNGERCRPARCLSVPPRYLCIHCGEKGRFTAVSVLRFYRNSDWSESPQSFDPIPKHKTQGLTPKNDSPYCATLVNSRGCFGMPSTRVHLGKGGMTRCHISI